MDFRIDELNQGLSLGLIVTVFTGMYFFASSIYLLENLELISSMSFSDDKWQVDRIKSDHDATIAFFPIPYDLQTNYKRDVWLYKHGKTSENVVSSSSEKSIGSNKAPNLVGSRIQFVRLKLYII
jgi:hypothetical protein